MTLTSSLRAASLAALLFLAVGSKAQTIVNTETLLAQVDSGWAATFGVVGDLSFGNSRVTDLSTDGSVGYTQGPVSYTHLTLPTTPYV